MERQRLWWGIRIDLNTGPLELLTSEVSMVDMMKHARSWKPHRSLSIIEESRLKLFAFGIACCLFLGAIQSL